MAVRKTAAGARLKRWFKEDWRTPSGEKDYKKGENTFRPTKKISKDTPKTWSQLSAGEKRAAAREKRIFFVAAYASAVMGPDRKSLNCLFPELSV